MTQAIFGGNIKIETLNGKIEVKIKPGTHQDEKIKIEGLGIHKLPPN